MDESHFKDKMIILLLCKHQGDLFYGAWICMEEGQVRSKYMLVVSHIYEKVIYHGHMGYEFLKFSISIIGVREGWPLSYILFRP